MKMSQEVLYVLNIEVPAFTFWHKSANFSLGPKGEVKSRYHGILNWSFTCVLYQIILFWWDPPLIPKNTVFLPYWKTDIFKQTQCLIFKYNHNDCITWSYYDCHYPPLISYNSISPKLHFKGADMWTVPFVTL